MRTGIECSVATQREKGESTRRHDAIKTKKYFWIWDTLLEPPKNITNNLGHLVLNSRFRNIIFPLPLFPDTFLFAISKTLHCSFWTVINSVLWNHHFQPHSHGIQKPDVTPLQANRRMSKKCKMKTFKQLVYWPSTLFSLFSMCQRHKDLPVDDFGPLLPGPAFGGHAHVMNVMFGLGCFQHDERCPKCHAECRLQTTTRTKRLKDGREKQFFETSLRCCYKACRQRLHFVDTVSPTLMSVCPEFMSLVPY